MLKVQHDDWGLDEYSVEFYKAFWPFLCPCLKTLENPPWNNEDSCNISDRWERQGLWRMYFIPSNFITPSWFQDIKVNCTYEDEDLLPQLIHPDHSSFVKAGYTSDNNWKQLKVIDHLTLHSTEKKRSTGSSSHINFILLFFGDICWW